MTLGIFTDDYYPFIGGMGRYVHELSMRLPPDQIRVFSTSDLTAPNHIRVTPALHRRLRNLSFSFWIHQNIERCIDRYGLSKLNIQSGPGGLFLLKQVNIPVVVTCHHTWWQQSHYIRAQSWKRIFIPLERRTYIQADKIICDAQDTKTVLVERYGVPSTNVSVIPIGIDTAKFFPIDGSEEIPNSLLFVGRLDDRKGIDFLIRAIPEVRKEIPGIKLHIAGQGAREKELRNYVRDHHLEDNVEFLGFVPEKQLNAWYNRVKCVVVPSVFEGFGLTVVEAMAAETPVIATNVDALRNIIEDEVDGYLVDYGDVSSLKDRIVILIKNEERRRSFVRNGKRKVLSEYNWDIILKAYSEEIAKV